MMSGLFGDDFNINLDTKPNVKSLIQKTNMNTTEESKESVDKILKSKAISLQERLAIITERVLTTLGKQKSNVLIIKDIETLHNYISDCIKIGRIDIDTETNNSLDPVTCQLMGPCFYAPGLKQAYVPLNHVNPETMERLSWQLTEQDIHNELQRILDAKTMVIMHNGKFDYEVLKCTCNIEIAPDWDTIIAAKLIDENEFKDGHAGLKYIYTTYIDPTQEKYDIDSLFTEVPYSVVDPDIFALYAATDALMTDKVYLMQKPFFEKEENAKVAWVFHNIEMPIVTVTAEMELAGVAIDTKFGEKLKLKYNKQLDQLDAKIDKQKEILKTLIQFWKTLPMANKKTRAYQPKKTKKSLDQIEKDYPYFDPVENKHYKIGKCRAEQIDDDFSLTSPVQLAVLFYDVLMCPAVSKKSPRGTGETELKDLADKLKKTEPLVESAISAIYEDIRDIRENKVITEVKEEEETAVSNLNMEPNFDLFGTDDLEEDKLEEPEEELENGAKISIKICPEMTNQEVSTLMEEVRDLYEISYQAAQKLCQTILDRRGIVKLITTYIDVIPDLTKHWPDGRIRFHLNSMGTDTGRYSSGGKLKFIEDGKPVVVSGINCQNIPSHNKEIRMLFMGQIKDDTIEAKENYYELPEISEIETTDGWKFGKDLQIGNSIISEDGIELIKDIKYQNKVYYLYI